MEERRGKNKTPFSGYCFLRNNDRLKDILLIMMDRNKMSIKDVADKLGVQSSNLRSFLHHGSKTISQHNVIRMCNLLGLEVELNITIKKE